MLGGVSTRRRSARSLGEVQRTCADRHLLLVSRTDSSSRRSRLTRLRPTQFADFERERRPGARPSAHARRAHRLLPVGVPARHRPGEHRPRRRRQAGLRGAARARCSARTPRSPASRCRRRSRSASYAAARRRRRARRRRASAIARGAARPASLAACRCASSMLLDCCRLDLFNALATFRGSRSDPAGAEIRPRRRHSEDELRVLPARTSAADLAFDRPLGRCTLLPRTSSRSATCCAPSAMVPRPESTGSCADDSIGDVARRSSRPAIRACRCARPTAASTRRSA